MRCWILSLLSRALNNLISTSGSVDYGEYICFFQFLSIRIVHLFSPHHRSAHIKLSLTIERGQHVSYDSSTGQHQSNGTLSLLGNALNKTTVLRSIASTLSINGFGDNWVLHLPTIHHAVVTANFVSDTLPKNVKEASPEILICDSFTAGISSYLSNLHLALERFQSRNPSKQLVSDHDIPLSLENGRLFTIALCRLPKKEQLQTLSKLLTMLNSHLQTINYDSDRRNLLTHQNHLSDF